MSFPTEVAKFLDGDVIIDRRNPFKENDNSDNESNIVYSEVVHGNGSTPNGTYNDKIDNYPDIKSPIPSLTSHAINTVRLPVKHNITGNILNIDEKKIFQHFNIEQTPEDLELIQKFLKEKDTDAYACLIRMLAMDNDTSKKKSLKNIIPSFFTKNNKHPKGKCEESELNKNDIGLPIQSQPESKTIDGNKNGAPVAKARNLVTSDSSSCSNLVSEGGEKVGPLVVSSTWMYKKSVEPKDSVQPNDTNSEIIKPKPKMIKPPRSRSLSPHQNIKKPSVMDRLKHDNNVGFEPQYAYVKPRSPIPSSSHNKIVTKPTVHQPASHDTIPNKSDITKNIPQVLKTKTDLQIDEEVQLRPKHNFSFDDKQVEYRKDLTTSSPVNNDTKTSDAYEHVGRIKSDNSKLSREEKEMNLRKVEAFYWSQLAKMKMHQDQELYKHYVISTNDMHNGPNNNYDKMRETWRCRSVSPNFARNYNSLQSPIHKRINSVDSSPLSGRFVRNTPARNTIGSTSNIRSQKFSFDIRNNNVVNPSTTIQTPEYGKIGIPINETVDNPLYGVVQKPQPVINMTKAPIFKKGSLYQDAVPESPNKEKRVSFTQVFSQPPKLQSVHENLEVGTANGAYGIVRLQTASLAANEKPFQAIYGKLDRKNVPKVYANVTSNKVARNNDISYDNDQLYAKVNNKTKASANNIARRLYAQRLNTPRNVISTESESGSEGGEVQRIMQNASTRFNYEDWGPDGKNRSEGSTQSESGRGRIARRDDPRRHTLGGDLLRSAPPHSALVRGMDIEHSLPRGYPPPSSTMLFDDDPGIMSEVETASTGFRRGGKQRSSLPVVRTPSKTLERPLGLVFLQYRNETKRALLPNEITSIDTVKALFVRSFPKQLTMEYLDSPLVKIYIHDSSKDMFYELEDLRSHLRDIRDRSVLRLFESADVSGGTFPGALGTGAGLPPLPSGPPSWDQDQSYFSEPEFDSDYHHQHIHKSKNNVKAPAYYMTGSGPTTLPRGTSLIRAYSPAAGPLPVDRMKGIPGSSGAPPKPLRAYGSTTSVIRSVSERVFPFSPIDGMRIDQLYSHPADRIHNDGYMSSPERGSRGAYEEPYYTQYVGPPRGGMTPVIDEETGDPSMLDDQYSLYNVKIPSAPRTTMRPPPYDTTRLNAHEELQQRMRVENMERQLANLTGLVQKALQAPVVAPGARGDFLPPTAHFRTASQDSVEPFLRNERAPKLGKGRYHKSVSFEKSVSFSDEPPDMNSPKQHSPQHAADTKPPKPAIKSSTLPRMSSQERDRLKPVPPPKPKALVSGPGLIMPPGQQLTIQSIEYQNYLKGLLKKCKELRMDMRNLRRLTLTQAHTMREMICDTFIKFRTATSGGGDFSFYEDSMRLAREEEMYKQEMLKLEADLYDLENTVEQLRGSVINRKARVNMIDVERMALVLSKSSKTVADLKVRFPSLHDGIKGMHGNEMEKVVREEKFLKEEPERLEMALRRCKKLTGTLVTFKRLASVQEQRSDGGRVSPGLTMEDVNHSHDSAVHSKVRTMGEPGGMAHSIGGGDTSQRSENALDALLDELQTFAKPPDCGLDGDDTEGEGEGERGLLRRLRGTSSPEASPAVIPRGQNVGKPPVPERNPELLQLAGRRAPPPPPPRTSSRSPLASPAAAHPQLSASNSSSCDSVDSQEGARARHDLLEQRHQELLRKQKALQEQYARLQQIQRGGSSLAVVPSQDLKKTGSESNLVTKLGLNMAPAAPISGSLTHLARPQSTSTDQPVADQQTAVPSTTSKVYETDIL